MIHINNMSLQIKRKNYLTISISMLTKESSFVYLVTMVAERVYYYKLFAVYYPVKEKSLSTIPMLQSH